MRQKIKAPVARKKLAMEVAQYIDAKSGCRKTVSAHKQAVIESQQWATVPRKGRGSTCVDEITKSRAQKLLRFSNLFCRIILFLRLWRCHCFA
jgi:hypothetical protein